MRHLFFVLLLSVVTFHSIAYAQENSDKKPPEPVQIDGKVVNDSSWHYYNEDPIEKEEELEPSVPSPAPAPVPTPTPSSKPRPEAFSVEWFKENYVKIENHAIDNPNDPNAMRALMYMEKVMLDKSETFAYKKRFHQQSDPNLQEGVRVPITGATNSLLIRERRETRKEAMHEIFKHVGVIFFHDPKCLFCSELPRDIAVALITEWFTLFQLSVSQTY